MGIVYSRSKALTANSANCICQSQTPGAAGNLTINGSAASGGVATLDTQRRVLLTFAADESGHNFTIYGTNQTGNAISEVVAGTTPGTVATNLDFLTVSRVAIDAAATGAITVGTNTTGSTPWFSLDLMRTPIVLGLQALVTGTVNYTVEMTNQDVNNLPSGTTYPTPFPSPDMAGLTASAQSQFTNPVPYFRLTINSGTGTVALTYSQAGP